jgi:23S rRNA (guanosine2251-2'-O)-methyltransferase
VRKVFENFRFKDPHLEQLLIQLYFIVFGFFFLRPLFSIFLPEIFSLKYIYTIEKYLSTVKSFGTIKLKLIIVYMAIFHLILPKIRSAHNVGAMFRTADAFGVDKIWLTGYTPVPPKPQIDKVSLGAEQWVPWEKRQYLKPVLRQLKKEGFQIVALEQTQESVDIADAVETRQCLVSTMLGIALIVGNEVTGVRKDILKMCDAVVHIPMQGMKESLNVSVAAGIAMHAINSKLQNHNS